MLYRHEFSAHNLLYPHGGHLILAVVAIYDLLLATFGLTSPVPFHAVSTLIYLLAAVLLFAYARRRVGDWLALLGTTVILFFGASALDLLFPFQMVYGRDRRRAQALLALDCDDRRGDVIACVLLVVSISFGEVGIAFAVGVLVRVALTPRRLAGRLYVVLVPLVLYALWWLGWGHTAPSHLSLHNVATTPTYVLNAIAAAVGALLGLRSSGNQEPIPVGQVWAPIMLVVAVALAAWRVRRLGGVPRGVWPALAIGATFWVLAGFNTVKWRLPTSDRDPYPGAVFILLIAKRAAARGATRRPSHSGGRGGGDDCCRRQPRLPRPQAARVQLFPVEAAKPGKSSRSASPRDSRPAESLISAHPRHPRKDRHRLISLRDRCLRLARLHQAELATSRQKAPGSGPTRPWERFSVSSCSPAAPSVDSVEPCRRRRPGRPGWNWPLAASP